MIYVSRADGAVIGKFSEEQLRAKITAGDISPGDLYLDPASSQWRSASEFPGASFPKCDPHEVLPPLPKPVATPKNKRQMSPLEIGVCCALIAAFIPLVDGVLFFVASLPLLIAAFVLAIVSIVRGKIAGGILLLMGIFFAFPMSCVAMTDRQEILHRGLKR